MPGGGKFALSPVCKASSRDEQPGRFSGRLPGGTAAGPGQSTDLIVQSCLSGEEYTTDILADLNGEIIAVVPRLRLETRAGIIYKGRTCHDERLISWGHRIGKALNIKGPANIQCFVSGDEISYFEVNPRFSAGLPLTIAAGVNSPWWLLRLLAGERPAQELLPFKPIMMTRYWSEVFHPVDSHVHQPEVPEEIRS